MNERARQVVGGGLHPELPPPTMGPDPRRDWFTELSLVLRSMWCWRVESTLVAVPSVTFLVLDELVGRRTSLAVVTTTVVVSVSIKRFRRYVMRRLGHAALVRHWDAAVRHARLATHNDRVPTPVDIVDIPAGHILRIRIPAGSTADQLDAKAEAVAAHLAVRQVRVERDVTNARYATVTVVRRDPLVSDSPPWPCISAERRSIWEPVSVGVDEMGHDVGLLLPEHNLLLGGEPGAGKSVALSQLVASVALDPDADLSLLDGKRVELAAWSRCARHSAGSDLSEAIDVLSLLQAEMDERYERLLEAHLRKVTADSPFRLHVVACDELAYYLNIGERRATNEFATLARDLVARGRAAGIIVLAATQKPSHDIIPTNLRDLFSFRWALRCATPQASDTVLGQGWASAGFSASDIDSAHRGIGLLLHEGGLPMRLRSYRLTDDDIEHLASTAAALRSASASVNGSASTTRTGSQE